MRNLASMGLIPFSFASRRLAKPLVLVALAAFSPGCDSGSFQGDLAPCVCDNGGCSAASCPMTLTLDGTCAGEMSFAEVLVGEHVEAARLVPQQPMLTCSRVEPGQQAVLWVRGGPWVWGPLVERCATPGENQAIVLQCVEAQ